MREVPMLDITPTSYDKHGPMFSSKTVMKAIVKAIQVDEYFIHRGNHMSKDLKNATKLVDEATKMLTASVNKMLATEVEVSEASKKVSGQVRDAAKKLSDGLIKVEKTANFDRLERLCELLERANTAMLSLATLEESGKLEKITKALKGEEVWCKQNE